MADHWHAILLPRHPSTISLVMEAIKVSSTRCINALCQQLGRLWQGRFFDRALRTEKECQETVEYIHLNPVKRGLVARPQEWKWSSVHDYTSGVDPPRSILPIDRVVLPSDQQAWL